MDWEAWAKKPENQYQPKHGSLQRDITIATISACKRHGKPIPAHVLRAALKLGINVAEVSL